MPAVTGKELGAVAGRSSSHTLSRRVPGSYLCVWMGCVGRGASAITKRRKGQGQQKAAGGVACVLAARQGGLEGMPGYHPKGPPCCHRVVGEGTPATAGCAREVGKAQELVRLRPGRPPCSGCRRKASGKAAVFPAAAGRQNSLTGLLGYGSARAGGHQIEPK